mmetsp:Transcript_18013/g.44721  ORF Transcript_18013/g.44721 Transcript_18013/m.44721 type:complete len:106 (-) Transcript_18013:109-426(-)
MTTEFHFWPDRCPLLQPGHTSSPVCLRTAYSPSPHSTPTLLPSTPIFTLPLLFLSFFYLIHTQVCICVCLTVTVYVCVCVCACDCTCHCTGGAMCLHVLTSPHIA